MWLIKHRDLWSKGIGKNYITNNISNIINKRNTIQGNRTPYPIDQPIQVSQISVKPYFFACPG